MKLNSSLKYLKKVATLKLRETVPGIIMGTSGILLQLTYIILGLLTWFLIGRYYYAGVLEGYEVDYATFLVVGVILNNVLTSASSTGAKWALLIYSNRYIRILLSKSNPYAIEFLSYIFEAFKSIACIVIQLVVAILFFNIKLPSMEGLFPALLVLALGITNEIALSYLINVLSVIYRKLRVQRGVIHNLISFVSTILSSTYYPLNTLPGEVLPLTCIFPKSVTIECVRLCFALNYNQLYLYLIILCVQGMILIPLTFKMYKRAVKTAEREGLKYLMPV